MLTAVNFDNLPAKFEFAMPFKSNNKNELFLAVGYAVHPNFRGHGLATRTLELALNYAKKYLKPTGILANTNSLNISSQSVLIKNGFVLVPTDSPKRLKFYKDMSKN